MTTATLEDLIGGIDLGDIEISADDLYRAGNTLALRRGVATAHKVDVNGISLDARYTLESARLTRMTVFDNEYRDNSRPGTYTMVSGILSNVHMTVEVQIGEAWIGLEELLFSIYSAKASGTPISLMDFKARLNGLGFRFGGDATIAWQHFGVSDARLGEIEEILKANGAARNIDSVPADRRGRMREIWEFPEGFGLEVASIEVSSSDREQSRTGQGFLNFVDAGVTSLVDMLRLKSQGAKLKAEAAEATGDEAIRLAAVAAWVNRAATAWGSNLGGRQQRLNVNDDGNVAPIGGSDNAAFGSDIAIDPVNVGIGRIGYVTGLDSEDQPIVETLDFWQDLTAAPAIPVADVEIDDLPTVETIGEAEVDLDAVDAKF
jgi:hypothetical protein